MAGGQGQSGVGGHEAGVFTGVGKGRCSQELVACRRAL